MRLTPVPSTGVVLSASSGSLLGASSIRTGRRFALMSRGYVGNGFDGRVTGLCSCKKVLPRLDKRVRKNYGQFTVTVVSR
jgi:hypothetical protein